MPPTVRHKCISILCAKPVYASDTHCVWGGGLARQRRVPARRGGGQGDGMATWTNTPPSAHPHTEPPQRPTHAHRARTSGPQRAQTCAPPPQRDLDVNCFNNAYLLASSMLPSPFFSVQMPWTSTS